MARRIILLMAIINLFALNSMQGMEKKSSKVDGLLTNLRNLKTKLKFKINPDPSALLNACIRGDVEKAKVLIATGADVNVAVGDSLQTLLHLAAEIGDLEVAKLLIDNGAIVNSRGGQDHTPLHTAAKNGHFEVAKLLIDRGADVNAKKKDGKMPLHYAADKGHAKIANLLIDRGAKVNAKIIAGLWQGYTPLHFAAKEGHAEVSGLLVDSGADVGAKDIVGWTPLHPAAENGYAKVVKLLLSQFAFPRAKISTTMFINRKGKPKIWDLKTLVLMNIFNSISECDERRYNDILDCFAMYSSLLSNCENIFPYIDLGQDRIRQIIAVNKIASNAMESFCKQRYFEKLKKRIAIKNNKNKTALDIARANNQHDCIELLESADKAQSLEDLPNDIKIWF